MKKLYSLLLSVALVFALVGCAEGTAVTNGEGSKPATPSVTSKTDDVSPALSTAAAATAAKITKEQAKNIVLNHAGLTADSIRRYKVELDVEKGTKIYEIEFEQGKYEYDYHIHTDTGKVLKAKKELLD